MDLVYSVALFGMATVISLLLFIAVRMPVEPAWASEGLIANVWCVLITGLIAYGGCFGVRFIVDLKDQTIGLPQAAMVIGLLAAFYLIGRAMSPRRLLAKTAAQPEGLQLSAPVPVGSAFIDSGTQASLGRPATNTELPRVA
jgi:hypothetical protein